MLYVRQLLILGFIGILLAGCRATSDALPTAVELTVTAPPIVTVEPMPPTADDVMFPAHIQETAAAYQELRQIPGHFEGGQWHDDVDQWMGRKHQYLLELAAQFIASEYSRADIEGLMGYPDEVVRQEDDLYRLISSLPAHEAETAASDKYLVYYWRGTHDFVFFICNKDDLIVGSDWFYAGE